MQTGLQGNDMKRHFLSSVIGSCILAFVVAGCDRSSPQDSSAKTVPADLMEVQVSAEMLPFFKTQTVKLTEVSKDIELSGSIEANERRVARIGASVTGRVTEVAAEVGEQVRPGQLLARISSPELTTAQLNYLRASATRTTAERAVDRAQQLYRADVIGAAELQRRESELAIANAELTAAGDQLRLLGVTSIAIEKLRNQGSLDSQGGVISTISGVVIERKVSQGQVAQPGDPLFTVADLSNVWVVGAIPEQVARYVRVGQSIEILVPALKNKVLKGKVVHVGDTVSPETRTVQMRTQVDNPNRDLKPQMLANMRIQGEAQRVLTVPSQAVVRVDSRDHVFVTLGQGRYRLTPVELSGTADEVRILAGGLQEGTEIVSEGAFHLNNERLRVAQER